VISADNLIKAHHNAELLWNPELNACK